MTAFALVLISKNPKGGFKYRPSGCDEGATLGKAVQIIPNPESGCTILQHPPPRTTIREEKNNPGASNSWRAWKANQPSTPNAFGVNFQTSTRHQPVRQLTITTINCLRANDLECLHNDRDHDMVFVTSSQLAAQYRQATERDWAR